MPSIAASDLILYSSANVPTDDASTSGGAIDTTSRPVVTQFSASAKLSLTSDAADTRNVTIVGRLSTGSVAQETVALNGTTEVLSANTYERLLSVTIASTSARTVTLKQGSGGTTIATIPANEAKVHINFQKAASSTGAVDRFEKSYWKNTHGTFSLLGAQVTLTADPASRIKMGLAAAVNGSTSVATRTSTPSSVTFVDDGVAQSVPGTDLAAGDAIGMWVEQSLLSNDAAQKNSFTTQLAGSSI